MLSSEDLAAIRTEVLASFADSLTVSRLPTLVSDSAGGSDTTHVDQPLLVYSCDVEPLSMSEMEAAQKIHANARFRIQAPWNADIRPTDRVKVKAGGEGPEQTYEILGEDQKISEQGCLSLLAGYPQ